MQVIVYVTRDNGRVDGQVLESVDAEDRTQTTWESAAAGWNENGGKWGCLVVAGFHCKPTKVGR